MPTKQYALIAREGHGTLMVVAASAAVLQFTLGIVAAIPAWLLLAFLLYMFRDPTQTPPSLPLAVVSPIHGQIKSVGSARDPWLKRAAQSIVFETGVLDVRSIYAPVEGKIMEQWSAVPSPASDDDNPPHSIAYWIRTDEDDDIVLVITRAPWGGPISFDYHPGERVGHGRRVGFANFGCSARLYLPTGSRCEVAAGDKVSAGSSIVGTLVHLTRMAKRAGAVGAPGEVP
jgi:phosphatidylserine decarboxylase